ncbi:MAG: PTS sugar transporter subunit IIA [Kiritimatiellae bacterium]|nr:PTS sugar transporter subunit IIA [Kiritimatiellia bacterium]
MKSQINILRQLQELVLTRDEHHQTGDGSHLDALNDSIAELQDKLDPQVQGLYLRLYKKSHIVMAAMSKGCCSACGMQVPIAQGQQVKLAQHLVTCSSCGRILFAGDADEARNVTEKPSAGDDPKTGISRFSAEELMIPALKATNEAEAIAELAEAMEAHHFIANADSLISAAMDREGVLSTAMDNGMAFPHVRGVEGGGLTLALGVSKAGIKWGGEKVHIVCLSAIPVAVSAFYLRLMAGLAQTFEKKENRDALRSTTDAASMWKALVKATRHTVK